VVSGMPLEWAEVKVYKIAKGKPSHLDDFQTLTERYYSPMGGTKR
jgi:hypothetical protein